MMSKKQWLGGLSLLLAGCGASAINNGANDAGNNNGGDGGGGQGDLFGVTQDLTAPQPNACGDFDPGCTTSSVGPPQKPFPLQSDGVPDPHQNDTGVDRDNNGHIVLSATKSNFDFLWLANTDDWNIGTVSKIDSKTVREVARYYSVTCFSNASPVGGKSACDGKNGCCARDDHTDFTYRLGHSGTSSGVHQGVQLSTNSPSRTAVDYNGDVWVANRAFSPGQSSVTKIANDKTQCPERNGTGGIQTSSDVNGDGVIDTDCNVDGLPDDVAGVKAKACANGMAQEFYGLDDECILFTTNTNAPNMVGRPLALGSGSVDFGPSDAWAGTYNDGKYFRVDGTSGMIKAQTQVALNPYGATVDASGILWTGAIGSDMAYFDTGNPSMVAKTRVPSAFGVPGYGITMDRDQNVWTGGWGTGHANRYTPNRSGNFATLGTGYWTLVTNPGGTAGATGNGRGIAADSRNTTSYFVWVARDGGFIARINASAIAVPVGADKMVDGSAMPGMRVAGSDIIGAGVDIAQNVWGISHGDSVATRIKVDNVGNMTAPDVTTGTPNAGCPVGPGDRCTLQLTGRANIPKPYTYSDFTGFGLRNFTNPKGSYSWIQDGCTTAETRWIKVLWDAEVPPNTSLTLRARSGNTKIPDNTWGAWTGDYSVSPADLKGGAGPMLPNPAAYAQFEFDLASMDKMASPKLKGFQIVFECGTIPQ